MKQRWLYALSLLTGLAAHSGYSQQAIEWNISRSIIAGTGCIKDVDAFAFDNGNDLAIVFSNLGLNLPGGSGSPLAGRSSCTVRVPAQVSKGLYIGELTQRVSYGITKTHGARGSLATRSTFFGFNVSPYTVNVPYGTSVNNPLLVNSRVDRFTVSTTPDWYRGWCRNTRNPAGIYQANFAVSGQRDSDLEDLIMFVDGLDLKFEVVASLVFCGV